MSIACCVKEKCMNFVNLNGWKTVWRKQSQTIGKHLNVNLLIVVIASVVSIQIVYRMHFIHSFSNMHFYSFRICSNCPSLKCNYHWFVDYYYYSSDAWATVVTSVYHYADWCFFLLLCFHRIECCITIRLFLSLLLL